jgi:hypothetical protein
MQLRLQDNLPFVAVVLHYGSQSIEIPNVLVDTGSATTILAADAVQKVQIFPEPNDTLFTIRGVGGSEVVFSRKVGALELGNCRLEQFEIEVGGMDYGFDINGILGMDFLTQARAILNLDRLEIEFGQS